MTLSARLLLVALLTWFALPACASTSVPRDDGSDVTDAADAHDAPTGDARDGTDTDAPDVPEVRTERIPDRSIVAWITADTAEPWWIEERIAPQPRNEGDRELGPRSIVRATPTREVVWQPGDTDRLTDACRHPSGEWTAVGVDSDHGIFVARGDTHGLLDRLRLEDPGLADDSRAWLGTQRTVPRVWSFSESSVHVVADGEDAVLAFMSEDNAVLGYRLVRREHDFVVGPHVLVSPATAVTPYLPIGGSYDDFDAVVAPYLVHLGIDPRGRVFVAQFADGPRIRRHNAVMGTSLSLIRNVLGPRENTLDALVSGIERDGTIAFATVVGMPDVEDEIFGIAVGETRVAVLGRHRRELGRDNTEIHVMVAELRTDGVPLATTSIDVADSGLAQSGEYLGEQLWIGGTESWIQNPTGRSVWGEGAPFLLRLSDAADGTRVVERFSHLLPVTSGHAELRALRIEGTPGGPRTRLFVGGHENGPQTHTGDADPSLIRSDAWWRETALP